MANINLDPRRSVSGKTGLAERIFGNINTLTKCLVPHTLRYHYSLFPERVLSAARYTHYPWRALDSDRHRSNNQAAALRAEDFIFSTRSLEND
jgi:hypothetical protein